MPERDQTMQDTLTKGLSLLDEFDRTKDAGDEHSRKLLLWKSAAEAEYLAFQISTIHGLMDYDPHSADSSRDADPQDPVGLARAMLGEARSSFQSNPRGAYQAVSNAVTILRRAYSNSKKPQSREKNPDTQK